MTVLEKRLITNYTTLVMGRIMTIEEVPEREVTLEDGIKSTIRQQIEIEKAQREIARLEAQL